MRHPVRASAARGLSAHPTPPTRLSQPSRFACINHSAWAIAHPPLCCPTICMPQASSSGAWCQRAGGVLLKQNIDTNARTPTHKPSHACLAPRLPAVEMTTGATIHTTNGLWLLPKPRVMPQHDEPSGVSVSAAAAAAAAITVPRVEQREVVLAFSDAPVPPTAGTAAAIVQQQPARKP